MHPKRNKSSSLSFINSVHEELYGIQLSELYDPKGQVNTELKLGETFFTAATALKN